LTDRCLLDWPFTDWPAFVQPIGFLADRTLANMGLSDRDLGPTYVWPIGLWSKRQWPIGIGLTDCFFVNFITTFNILHDWNETTKRKERIVKTIERRGCQNIYKFHNP
jgi:hypothetical protein